MHIKTTVRYQLIAVRMAIIKRILNAGEEGVKRRKSFYTLGRNANWQSHCGDQYGGSLKKKKKN